MKNLFEIFKSQDTKKIIWMFIKSYAIFLLIVFTLSAAFILSAYKSAEKNQNEMIFSLLREMSSKFDANISSIQLTISQLSFSPQIQKLITLGDELTGEDRYDIYFAKQELSKLTYNIMPEINGFVQEVYIYCAKPKIAICPSTVYALDYFVNRQYGFENDVFLNWCDIVLTSDRKNHIFKLDQQGESQYFYFQKLTNWPLNADVLVIIALRPQAIVPISEIKAVDVSNYMTNSFGETIACSSTYPSDSLPGFDSMKGNTGTKIVKINSKSCIVTWYLTLNYGWKYVNIMPKSLYYSSTTAVRLISLLYSILLCLLGVVTSLVISTKRYKLLTKIIKSIPDFNDDAEPYKYAKKSNPQLEMIKAGLDKLILQNQMLMRTNHESEALISKFQKEIQDNYQALRQDFIYKIMTGQIEYEIIPELLSFYSIEFSDPLYISIVIHIDDCENFIIEDTPKERKRARHAIRGLIGQFIEWNSCSCCIGKDTMGVIVNFEREGPKQKPIAKRLQTITEKLRDFASIDLNIGISVGIGNEHEGPGECTKSYFEAVQALGYRIYLGPGSVISYSDIVFGSMRFYYSIEEEMHLIRCLRNGDEDCCFSVLNEIFTRNLKNNQLNAKKVNLLFLDMMRLVTRVMDDDKKLRLEEDQEGDPFQSLMQSTTIKEMKDSVFSVYSNICRRVRASNESNSGKRVLIHQIVKYISDNYMDDNINQGEIARRFSIAPSILSVQYKKETGLNMLEHINFLRIKKAKQIIDNEKGVLLNDVAGRTGFTNVKTLIRVFKKFEGVTPGNYKQSQIN